LITGYDPIATFASAWRNQHALLAAHASERPYPATILWDLLDFALGSGWISFALIGMFLVSVFVNRSWHARENQIAFLGIAQLLIVAILGLLQSETARVWNFLLPLLVLPIALELRTWSRGPRLVVFVCLLMIL